MKVCFGTQLVEPLKKMDGVVVVDHQGASFTKEANLTLGSTVEFVCANGTGNMYYGGADGPQRVPDNKFTATCHAHSDGTVDFDWIRYADTACVWPVAGCPATALAKIPGIKASVETGTLEQNGTTVTLKCIDP